MNTIHTTRKTDDQSATLSTLKRWIERQFATMLLNTFREGTIMGQVLAHSFQVAGIGEEVADGMDYPILLMYSSDVLGAAGAPASGDRIMVVNNRPGSRIIIGKIVGPH